MHNTANFAGPSKGTLHTQRVTMLKHCFFLFIKNEYYSVQASKFFYLLRSKGQNFFPQLWVARIFILYTKTARHPLPPPQNQTVVPKINQEINEPSYKMVGVKITVACYGQNNRILGILFLVDFLFSSLTTPNVFIVMVLKCTY